MIHLRKFILEITRFKPDGSMSIYNREITIGGREPSLEEIQSVADQEGAAEIRVFEEKLDFIESFSFTENLP